MHGSTARATTASAPTITVTTSQVLARLAAIYLILTTPFVLVLPFSRAPWFLTATAAAALGGVLTTVTYARAQEAAKRGGGGRLARWLGFLEQVVIPNPEHHEDDGQPAGDAGPQAADLAGAGR